MIELVSASTFLTRRCNTVSLRYNRQFVSRAFSELLHKVYRMRHLQTAVELHVMAIRQHMNTYIQKVLGILSIGGGFIAIASILNFMNSSADVTGYIFGGIASLVFLYGIWCGIEIIKSTGARALFVNQIFWGMQIPLLLSPGVSYFLYAGFNFTVHYSFTESAPGFNMSYGGNLMLSLFQFSSPFQVGINIFALVVFCYLRSVTKKLGAKSSIENV
jgi:hypothetical protein